MTRSSFVTETDDFYHIRRYGPDDLEGFLALHEHVYDDEKSREVFEWRYNSPYVDHVPIFVAAAGDEIAGATAYLPFRVGAGGETTLALQPANAMVHPDHRRQGLFSKILTSAIDFYQETEASLFFNFPTDMALSSLLRLGWEEVGTVPTWYRFQRPAAMVDRDRLGALYPIVDRSGTALAGGFHRIRRGSARRASHISVERFEGVPAALLERLYLDAVPSKMHVVRDRQYFEWRFGNPTWSTVTYVASVDGAPVASIVASTRRRDGVAITALMDALPAVGKDGATDAFEALLDALIRDQRDVAVFRVTGSSLPAAVLSRFGFFSDANPPLSWGATPTHMVTRPIVDDGDASWLLGGHHIVDQSNWLVALGDQDAPF